MMTDILVAVIASGAITVLVLFWLWLSRVEEEWRILLRGYVEHLTKKPLPGTMPRPEHDIPPIGFPTDDDVPGFRRRPFQPPIRIEDNEPA